MAYNFFGDQRDQPWSSHWSRENNLANAPFSFNNRKYYSNYFNMNRRSEPFIHHHRPSTSFSAQPPLTPPSSQSATNRLTEQHIAMSGLNGSKAKFRFHGGIGDGRGGLACRMPTENASPHLIKLFDELNPIDMLIKAPSVGFPENHVARAATLSSQASNGTGVFLPVYPKKIHSKKGMRCGNGDCWNETRDVTKSKECAKEEAIPEELMLSGHTGHLM